GNGLGDQREKGRERQQCQFCFHEFSFRKLDEEFSATAYTVNPANGSVLSPKRSALTPMRCMSDSQRLQMGVSSEQITWRPGLILPPPLPNSTVGMSACAWR